MQDRPKDALFGTLELGSDGLEQPMDLGGVLDLLHLLQCLLQLIENAPQLLLLICNGSR